MLLFLVLVPLAIGDAVSDVLGQPEGRIYPLATLGTPSPDGAVFLHVGIVAMNELQQTATLRVAGHYQCAAGCGSSECVLFVAVRDDEGVGMPPAVAINLAPGDQYINQSIDLPARGHASRYPFDRYELVLGLVVQRVWPDGTVRTLSGDAAAGSLALSVQEEVARMVMGEPIPYRVGASSGQRHLYEYLSVNLLTIERPLYLRILAVLLVLLVAAASSYAVFMRPLHDLVLNAGALVVGIWGVRAMLVPLPWTWLTAVDLSLSIVIIFLLGAITVRALVFTHARAGMPLLRRRGDGDETDRSSAQR